MFDRMILEQEIKIIVVNAVEGGQNPSMELNDSHLEFYGPVTYTVCMRENYPANISITACILRPSSPSIPNRISNKYAGGAVRMRTFRTKYGRPFSAFGNF